MAKYSCELHGSFNHFCQFLKNELINSIFDDKTRAPIWYSDDGLIDNCDLQVIKLLKECNNTKIKNTNIISPEFG